MSSLPITIYEYIKMDHQKVANLFNQFEKSESKQRKKQIVEVIITELTVHLLSEEETFYKILEHYYESEKEVLHGREEHEEIEEQIELLKTTSDFGATGTKRVIKLKELVEHHVKEEESDIFKKAKKVLSDEEALIIKEKMHYLKMKLLDKIKKEEK